MNEAKGFAMQYYQEGYDAYDHTKGIWSVNLCPYKVGTYSCKLWVDGLWASRDLCLLNEGKL